jgi:uncharacterized glyoxalase superfamily protein PhnB
MLRSNARRTAGDSMPETADHRSNIYPSLSYDDAPAAIEWLCSAFGFTKRLLVPGPKGTVLHSELTLGPAVILVSSSKPESGRVSPRRLAGVNQAICVRIENPDAHFERASAAGAELLQPLKDEDHGSRGYMVKDIEGHHWYFGTYQPGAYW